MPFSVNYDHPFAGDFHCDAPQPTPRGKGSHRRALRVVASARTTLGGWHANFVVSDAVGAKARLSLAEAERRAQEEADKAEAERKVREEEEARNAAAAAAEAQRKEEAATRAMEAKVKAEEAERAKQALAKAEEERRRQVQAAKQQKMLEIRIARAARRRRSSQSAKTAVQGWMCHVCNKVNDADAQVIICGRTPKHIARTVDGNTCETYPLQLSGLCVCRFVWFAMRKMVEM